MMKILTLSLNDDLQSAAMAACSDKSILVYPTRSAANQARLREMDSWQLQELIFLSMEEFKEALILPDASVLTDEKRLLCLYLVMGEALREFFHILSYADIVSWGNNFFDFFAELAEECVPVESLKELKDSGVFHLQMWQETYLERILAIRADYFSYISALGFTDKIFYLQSQNFCIPYSGYQIVFVNQYYYSALDKALLSSLEANENQVTVIYQGLEVARQGENWKVQDFDLPAAYKSLLRKPRIRILESNGEDQMALSFLAWLSSEEPEKRSAAIIDSSFHNKNYSRYFSPQRFRIPEAIPFCESKLYQMLAAILAGMKAIGLSGGYLPISLLARLISTPWFLPYFWDAKGDQDTDEYQEFRLGVWQELSKLINHDFLYVDLKLFDDSGDSRLKTVLQAFMAMLEAFAKVKNIDDLYSLMDAAEGLQTSRLMDSRDRDFSDLQACFWERLANFAAIENLGLIPAWAQIFTDQSSATGILELLLNFLKSARISYKSQSKAKADWEISNLLDARNRSFDCVAFFQMIEGIIPSNPSPVWLFNETQRSRLGLKTYSDIRAWERYYFFRLLLTARDAMCFSYRNLERDISPSSFIGELDQLYKELKLNPLLPEQCNIPVKALYQTKDHGISALCRLENCCPDKNPPPDFFVLPCDPLSDFAADKTLRASASGIMQLLKNPFLWYIETKSYIRSKAWEAPETISSKLFGNIMHAYFANILGKLHTNHSGLEQLEQVFGDRTLLQNGLIEVINSSAFRYQIPKNYNADFLCEIISERLAESLYQFYAEWLKNRLQHRNFTLIPEKDVMTDEERAYKYLGSVLANEAEYKVLLHGKADLRIETETEAMIIDFKTGSYDYRQLIIYEWVYYLLNEVLPEEQLSSLFWNILDPTKSNDNKINSDKRDKLKQEILSTLSDCLSSGYAFGKKASDRQRLKNISRADLYKAEKEAPDA